MTSERGWMRVIGKPSLSHGLGGDADREDVERDDAPGDDARGRELAREQAHLSMLYGWLDRLRERAGAQLARAQRQDGPPTPQGRLERDAMVAMHANRLSQLLAVEHGLCIGRLDHRDGSRMYVGRLGLFDDEHEPLLIDWRAPAAAPFYRATPVTRGPLVRRRHFQARGRLLTGFQDDVLDLDALGDGERSQLSGEAALLASLTARRTGRMGDIVATIQAEQDQVIRSDLAGILVVHGGPGTGKTAVALHRAAYLLYTHRDRLAGQGVLVVGPNPTFLRYVEQVLPSLGETDVLLATIDELYPGVAATGREPVEAATVKGDLRMVEVLAAAVRDRQRVPDGPVGIVAAGEELRLDRQAFAHARDLAVASGRPHNQARGIFVGELLATLARQIADRIEEDIRAVEDRIDDSIFGEDEQLDGSPLLDQAELADLRAQLYAMPPVRALLDRLWPKLTPQRLLADLFSSAERIETAAAGLGPDERALLLRDPGADRWTPADVPLLDEAAELLGEDDTAARRLAARRALDEEDDRTYASGVLEIVGVDGGVLDPALLADRYRQRGPLAPLAERARQDRTWLFGHVIVDEAQELSAMAWRMLMRRCPSRSMTVVGDPAQTGAPGGATSWEQALGPHAAGRWREERLTVNYRTPAEIMDVAADLLATVAPQADPPASVRRGGAPPWRLQVAAGDLDARLPGIVAAEAAAVRGGRLAVLVPEALAETLRRRLAAALPESAAGSGPDVLDAPVAVLTATEAKGLEFDTVIAVEPALILAESPTGANHLYVALTRATQRLGVVHTTSLPQALSRLAPPPGTGTGTGTGDGPDAGSVAGLRARD